MTNTNWTPQEEQILRDNYFDCTWPELHELLPGRSENGITGRARRMRLRRKRTRGGSGYCWKPAEDKTLQDMYWDRTPEEIMQALPGRSWNSIHSRAARRGIRRKHVRHDHLLMKRAHDKPVVDAVIQFFMEYGFPPQRADITRITGFPHSTVARSVSRLIERGLLVRSDASKYSPVGLAPPLRKKLLEQQKALRDRVKAVA